MSRRRFIFDPDAGKMVEIGTESQVSAHTQVVGDIEPYRSTITGEMITGRLQHREHMKRHGTHVIESKEPPIPEKPKLYENRDDYVRQLRYDMKVAERQVRDGLAPTLQQLRERGLAE